VLGNTVGVNYSNLPDGANFSVLFHTPTLLVGLKNICISSKNIPKVTRIPRRALAIEEATEANADTTYQSSQKVTKIFRMGL
jgi:hypothetical protein